MSFSSFDLHKLGWKAFEDLVACVFRDIMGQSFQSFAEGPDGGRDGVFYGAWQSDSGQYLSGSFVIQCKHTSKPGSNLTKAIFETELAKVRRLADKDLADNYIFVTNHLLPAETEHAARDAFVQAGAGTAFLYGYEWLNSQVTESSRLRRLVPRLYGLGDLTQIVNNQAYQQARELLDYLTPDIECFVPTDSYRKCARALREQGFVLLLGEPASGKTMIANLLALSAADEWELQTLMLSDPHDLNQRWDPDDPGQFFWVDDAFGSTQYDPRRAREWSQRLPLLKAAIGKGARAVFTSRDYIYRSALNELKTSAFELFDDSRIVIELEQLTEQEKQQILYNHLKCGKQTKEFRRSVKPWLVEAASTPRFLPEIARRFSDPKFTRKLAPGDKDVKQFFTEPVKWLEGVLKTLGSAEKAAIALIFIEGGRIGIPIPEDDRVRETIGTMRSTIGDVKAAFVSLDDSLIRRVREDGRMYWRFRHPTVRDAFAALVASDPELIDIYLAGVTTERLLEEVTCGNVDMEGAKIVISLERSSVVLDRLRAANREPGSFFDPVNTFLSRRCSSEFLHRYFTELDDLALLPGEVRSLNPFDNALLMLLRLKRDGLLPEGVRVSAVGIIKDIAIQRYSCEFANNPVCDLLLVEERLDILEELSDILFSNVEDIIREIRECWDGEEDPDDLFSAVKTSLTYFQDEGGEDEAGQAEGFLERIREAVSEMYWEQQDVPEVDALEAEWSTVGVDSVRFGIFQDVDE